MRDKRYRRSAPRQEALERLNRLKKGARLASSKSIPRDVMHLTYHSAIFQACATLEEYLKQIFDHWLYELRRLNLNGTHVPPRARFSYIGRELSDAFSRFSYAGDEKDLALRIEAKSSEIDFALGNRPALPHFTGEFAYKGKKYPSPNNIRSLYARIGCDNIFDRLSREMKADAELKLRAFNDIRTAIAHSEPPDITLLDVFRNLDDVGILIRSLDKVSHREFSKHFVGGVW